MRSPASPRRQQRSGVDLYGRWMGGFAAAGVVLPLLLLGTAWMRASPGYSFWDVLWPFVVQLRSVMHRHPGWSLRDGVALLIAYNALWYALLGAIFGTGHVLARFMGRGWEAARD